MSKIINKTSEKIKELEEVEAELNSLKVYFSYNMDVYREYKERVKSLECKIEIARSQIKKELQTA